MVVLGDENAERGYQQIIDTYREAKQWQQATAPPGKRCRSFQIIAA